MSGGQKAVLVIVTLVVAVGAFLVLRPGDKDSEPATTTSQQTQATTTQDDGQLEQTEPETVQRIEVKGGRPKGGLAEIEARQGDAVRFEVTSDEDHEIHLHGYDVAKDVTAAKPAKFQFKATETGIFEIEIEDTGTQIAELKVER